MDIYLDILRNIAASNFTVCTKAALVKDYDGYCAEMEGASMAQVATLNKIPFVIIRAISDKADNSAPVAYETFEEQAIVHTVKLLAAMFLKMSK